MKRDYDMFVILADMRTGSNLLESTLNGVAGLVCHGEAFNPHFVGYPKRTEVLGVTRDARESDPMLLLDRIREAPGLNGFRYFNDHDPRVFDRMMTDPRCAKIVLTRNPAESYVSLKIARQTGQWKLGNAKHRKTTRIKFDPVGFEMHLEKLQAFQIQAMRALQTTGQSAFYVDYEDIRDVDVINGLLRFMGLDAQFDALPETLVRQNPGGFEEKVSNHAAMEAALARIDRFNLSRTPNFEPRRGPGVPTYIAAPSAALLYLPIKAGPVAQVHDWLLALDGNVGNGRTEAFTQKTLRQWKRKNTGHLTFTVLRHPIARAHAAFCEHILSNDYAEIRETLRQVWKLPLPPADMERPSGLLEHRQAFLVFLGFLKANLAGETSLRVDPAWASQSAITQGFAQFALPDLILREQNLEADLAWLASRVGRKSPGLPEDAGVQPHSLADIYDEEVESAGRAAYQRDYMTFGFGPWQA